MEAVMRHAAEAVMMLPATESSTRVVTRAETMAEIGGVGEGDDRGEDGMAMAIKLAMRIGVGKAEQCAEYARFEIKSVIKRWR